MTTEQQQTTAKLDYAYPHGGYARRITSGPVAGAFWVEYTRYDADRADTRWIVYQDGTSKLVERHIR